MYKNKLLIIGKNSFLGKNLYKGVNSRLDELQASFLRIKLKKLDNDKNVRIIVIKGEGKNFSSGGDINFTEVAQIFSSN